MSSHSLGPCWHVTSLPSAERLALPQATKRKEAAGVVASSKEEEEEAELMVTVPAEPPPPSAQDLRNEDCRVGTKPFAVEGDLGELRFCRGRGSSSSARVHRRNRCRRRRVAAQAAQTGHLSGRNSRHGQGEDADGQSQEETHGWCWERGGGEVERERRFIVVVAIENEDFFFEE